MAKRKVRTCQGLRPLRRHLILRRGETADRRHIPSRAHTVPVAIQSEKRNLLQKLNRADAAHLGQWKNLIVPSRWDVDELAYSPLPEFIEELTNGPQTLVVDLPAQTGCSPPSLSPGCQNYPGKSSCCVIFQIV